MPVFHINRHARPPHRPPVMIRPSHGEIIHIKCRHVDSDGISDSVAHVLRRNAGLEFCQSCIARMLHITYEQAVKAVTAVRMTSRYRVRAMGPCSVCGNHWITVRAEPISVGGGT